MWYKTKHNSVCEMKIEFRVNFKWISIAFVSNKIQTNNAQNFVNQVSLIRCMQILIIYASSIYSTNWKI